MAFRIARKVTITEPSSHAFTINVTQSKSTGAGPLGVHFDCIAGSDFDGNTDPAKSLSFWWDFGDDGAVFTNAGRAGETFGTDANIAQGPWVAHVYPENNTGSDVVYTGHVYVYDHISGKSGKGAFTVTVQDSDTFFAGTNTIVVSQVGDFTGAPIGARQETDIRSVFNGGNYNGSYRILLKAGETFTFNTADGGATSFVNPRLEQVLHISSFGVGSPPEILSNSTDKAEIKDLFWLRESSEIVISGIVFNGNYDASTGAGWSARTRVVFCQDFSSFTLYKCNVSGFGFAANFSSQDSFSYVFDSTITNWADMGVFSGSYGPLANTLSVVGSTVKQNPLAVSGDDAKQFSELPIWADHGPIRIQLSKESYISRNDMFSNAGWSSEGLAHQPCIRYHTSTNTPSQNIGHSGSINQNVLEGGYIVALLETANGSIAHELGTPIFESNYLIATDNTIDLISTGFGNSVIRNNVGFRGDFPNDGNLQNFKGFINTDSTKSSSDANLAEDIKVSGNSLISIQQDGTVGNLNFVDNNAGLSFVESQNLVYAPSVPNAGDFVDYSPLDSNNYYSPLSTSAAYQTGTKEQYLWDTFDGQLRDSPNNNIGALSSVDANQLPTINAGPDATATNGDTVTLSATASNYDSLLWTCTSGQSPTFSDATVLNPTVTFNEVGSHVLQLTATNSEGSSSDTVTYSVSQAPDVTKPVITLLGSSSVTISEGDTYTDAGATATDDRDGDITSDIVVVNPVDVNNAGTYTITYNVTDAAGNAATQVTRSVTVQAVTPVVESTLTVSYTGMSNKAYDTVVVDVDNNEVIYNQSSVWTNGSHSFTFVGTPAGTNVKVMADDGTEGVLQNEVTQ